MPASGNVFPDAFVPNEKIGPKRLKIKPDLNSCRYNSEGKGDEAGKDIPAVDYVLMYTITTKRMNSGDVPN